MVLVTAMSAVDSRMTPPLLLPYEIELHSAWSCHLSSTKEKMNTVDQELIEATRENNLSEVERLLSVGADVNAKDVNGWTPLHWACMKGHVTVVIELMEHGADIEVTTITLGWMPLHLACLKGHLAICQQVAEPQR
jgi:ankyrin repeat protein